MTRIIRQALWDAQVAQSGHYDKIIVQNLDVVVNAGKDVWGREKSQRALISVTVTLNQEFASASNTDTVDGSTIHYGILSKAVQAQLKTASSTWSSTAALSSAIADSVRKVAGSTPIYAIETNVCYIKGSMFGDGAGMITSSIEHAGPQSHVLYLQNVRIPCLIGVNSNERLQQQPIVLNLWVDCVHETRSDDHAQLETLLFTEISKTEFQTIESMLDWVIQKLLIEQVFTGKVDKDAWIKLRIEKPMAVPFADAPAVEITRPIRFS